MKQKRDNTDNHQTSIITKVPPKVPVKDVSEFVSISTSCSRNLFAALPVRAVAFHLHINPCCHGNHFYSTTARDLFLLWCVPTLSTKSNLLYVILLHKSGHCQIKLKQPS